MRLAVVSPSVDRRHGTERAIAELVERLARVYQCEVHLFAQRVADLNVMPAAQSTRGGRSSGAGIYWHRVPIVPGPQLLRFGAWFLLNGIKRSSRDFDLVISPGINCVDADVVIVHAVFRRFAEVAHAARGETTNPTFFRRLHRRLYYLLLSALERKIYGDDNVVVAAVSRHTASIVERYFHRKGVRVIPNGVNSTFFSTTARLERRDRARQERSLRPDDFVLLFIGNNWATKGIQTVFEALTRLTAPSIRLLIVGTDDREAYAAAAAKMGVLDRCIWQPSTEHVLDCYAAADVYVSPSREDPFALPVLEAMACGLPAITSSAAGVSELVEDGANAFVLQNPRDTKALVQIVTRLHEDPVLRSAIAEAGARAAQEWTWDRNAAAVWQLLSEVAPGRTARRRSP